MNRPLVLTALLISSCSHEKLPQPDNASQGAKVTSPSRERLPPPGTPLEDAKVGARARSYVLGDRVQYLMRGHSQAVYARSEDNKDYSYSSVASLVVKQSEKGAFFEEASWNELNYNDQRIPLDSKSLAWRQQVSLDPNYDGASMHAPDTRDLDHRLRIPAEDLLNFYVDGWLAAKLPQLQHAGDHIYLPIKATTVFLNGRGYNCFDFDVTLRTVDAKAGVAVLDIKHVPPKAPCVAPAEARLPSAGDYPNNIVTMDQTPDRMFDISIGTETLTTVLSVQLGSGKILSGSISDTFQWLVRVCNDSAGTDCRSPVSARQQRDVSMVLKEESR